MIAAHFAATSEKVTLFTFHRLLAVFGSAVRFFLPAFFRTRSQILHDPPKTAPAPGAAFSISYTSLPENRLTERLPIVENDRHPPPALRGSRLTALPIVKMTRTKTHRQQFRIRRFLPHTPQILHLRPYGAGQS